MKLYEDFVNNPSKKYYYLVIEMAGGIVSDTDPTLFEDKESMENYIIQLIHNGIKLYGHKNKEDDFDGDEFDVDDLLDYWNSIKSDNGYEINYYMIPVQKNIELSPKLKLKKAAKKYNL